MALCLAQVGDRQGRVLQAQGMAAEMGAAGAPRAESSVCIFLENLLGCRGGWGAPLSPFRGSDRYTHTAMPGQLEPRVQVKARPRRASITRLRHLGSGKAQDGGRVSPEWPAEGSPRRAPV